MPKRKIEKPNKIGAHCSECSPNKVGINHHRCYVVACACVYHRIFAYRKENDNASKSSQHERNSAYSTR